MFLKKIPDLLLAFALLMFAGQASAQSVSLAVGGDGSTTVSGSGTEITVDVSQMGITATGNAIQIVFDITPTTAATLTGAPTGMLISGGNTASLLSITSVSVPASASFTFTTASDVTDVEFSIGIRSISVDGAALTGVSLPAALMFNAANNASPDFDGDGTVGVSDFLLFVDHFGTSSGDAGYDAKYDLDGNGAIGIPDFLAFVNSFGSQVPPSGGGGGSGGSPDLIVESPSVSDNTLTTGQSFTLSATVRNQGTGSSASTTLRYYQSSNATISTSDTSVGTDSVNGLSASGTSAESISLNAPSSAGTYYYGACVASVSGESDTNNNCSDGVSVTVSSSSGNGGGGGGSDSYTPLSGLRVRNGGFTHTSISLPFIGQVWIDECFSSGTITVNDVSYTIHSSRWQKKSGTSWVDISGTTRTGEICAYQTTNPGEYRLVVEMSVNGVRGQYISENTFTVSSSSGGSGGSSQTCNVGLAMNPGEGCDGSGYSLRNDSGVLVVNGNIGGIQMNNARYDANSVRLNRMHLTRSDNVWTIVSLP